MMVYLGKPHTGCFLLIETMIKALSDKLKKAFAYKRDVEEFYLTAQYNLWSKSHAIVAKTEQKTNYWGWATKIN